MGKVLVLTLMWMSFSASADFGTARDTALAFRQAGLDAAKIITGHISDIAPQSKLSDAEFTAGLDFARVVVVNPNSKFVNPRFDQEFIRTTVNGPIPQMGFYPGRSGYLEFSLPHLLSEVVHVDPRGVPKIFVLSHYRVVAERLLQNQGFRQEMGNLMVNPDRVSGGLVVKALAAYSYFGAMNYPEDVCVNAFKNVILHEKEIR